MIFSSVNHFAFLVSGQIAILNCVISVGYKNPSKGGSLESQSSDFLFGNKNYSIYPFFFFCGFLKRFKMDMIFIVGL